MAISGRFVALLALGVLPVVLVGDPSALVAWLGFAALLGGLDLLLAGSPRALRFERVLPGPVRLAETVESRLFISNTGRRRVRAVVRDGWPPSAGATPTRQRLVVPAAERRAITTRLTPFRRGERRA